MSEKQWEFRGSSYYIQLPCGVIHVYSIPSDFVRMWVWEFSFAGELPVCRSLSGDTDPEATKDDALEWYTRLTENPT